MESRSWLFHPAGIPRPLRLNPELKPGRHGHGPGDCQHDAHICPRRRRASDSACRRILDCPGTPALSLWLLVLPAGMP